MRLSFPLLAVTLTVLAIAGGLVLLVVGQDARHREPSLRVTGTALIGGPFALEDASGKTWTEQSWPGQYLLVYFGFTNCPGFCQTDLARNAGALALLQDTAPQDAARIQPLFITLDPERDTPETVAAFIRGFDPDGVLGYIALSGSVAAADAARKAYRVYAEKRYIDEDFYVIDHSLLTYLMAPDGSYVKAFSSDVSPDALAQHIRDLMS